MATVVLLLFVLAFVAMLLYAFRLTSLAVPLGIMTYAYKQIASLALPFLQSQGALFNYSMAGLIALIFAYSLLFRHPGIACRTREGQFIQLLLWCFLGFFWVSLLWSPFYGTDPSKFVPYFVVYFWMLPLLMEDPESMLVSYRAIWGLTLLGAVSLLLSPDFYVSPDLGRMVVHFSAGSVNEATPLAIADMGAYLILLSVLVLLTRRRAGDAGWATRVMLSCLAFSGIGLGFWLALNTSRGETFAGVACGCLLIALVKGRNLSQYIAWMTGIFAILGLLLAVAFVFFLPKKGMTETTSRYTPSAIVESSGDRKDLGAKSVEMAMTSPKTFLFGVGARASEKRMGMSPHNHFIQAFGETGIIGLSLLTLSSLLALKFGFRTLAEARKSGDYSAFLFSAFTLTLLTYQLIILSKKGSLTYVDTYMWLSICVFGFDRTQTALQTRAARERDASFG